ncbi:MAG: hypothetical protein M3Q19_02985 [Pseudomonadota bacterium]|nr:hypothetical protein [Pseudomonadota bacterium]
MRSNSGSGKSNNNLRDPTLKEHEEVRDKRGSTPAHGRAERAEKAKPGLEPTEAGPAR